MRFHRLFGRHRRFGLGQSRQRPLGALERRVEGRRRDGLALERALRRLDLVTELVDETFRLRAGCPNGLVAFATCAATFLLGHPQGVGGACLGGPRALEGVARRALGFPDRGEGRLERALRLGQARPGVGHDRVRQPEPFGDRERLAAAGQPDRQPVRRRQGLEVELDCGVPCPGRGVGIRLQLGVVGRGGDERARGDEVVEQRLGERRALGRVRAGAELVEQHERARPGLLHDPHDRAQVPGERRERLGDRLFVADVGEHVAQHGQAAARGGRDVEPGLVHQREQPERAQRDGLAAGVRAGHDERRVVAAEADVDRDDAAGQARVAGGQELDLGTVRGLGPDGAHVAGQLGLRRPEVEPGQRVERLAQRRGVGGDERRQLVEDPGDLLVLRDLRFAPGVTQLDRDERLHEQRLAAPRRIVDDALDPAPRLGLDRDHVAPVAKRHDGLLERRAELRADQRVEPSPEPVVRHAHRRPEPAQPRRRGVEQLADRIEAAGQRRADRGQRMQLAAEVAEQRPPLVGKRRGEPRRRVERLRDLEEVGRIETTAPSGALDPRPDVVRRPDPDPRPILEQRPSLVGLVEAARHDHRLARRLEPLGQPTRRTELGQSGEALADLRELEQRDRAAVHRVGPRLSAGRPARTPRDGPRSRTATRGRSTAHRRRRSRFAAWRGWTARRSPAGRVSSRSGDPASHRSVPVHVTSIPKAAATRPGPLARR